jgi:hypothetical protein
MNRIKLWWQAAIEPLQPLLGTMKQDRWFLAAMLAGIIMIGCGFSLLVRPDWQVRAYNAGLVTYKKETKTPEGSISKAIKLFDISLMIYDSQRKGPWLERVIYPYPSTEIAARANFQKAKALLLDRKAEMCAEAFQDGLRLNPGTTYKGYYWEDIVRLGDIAQVTRYDLEILYAARPDIAQAQGKNKGKKPGQPGQPRPADNPQSGPGKGSPDDI